MRYVKLLGLALAAWSALGIATAAAALALPVLSVSLEGAYPLHVDFGSLRAKAKVSDPVESLDEKGFELSLTASTPTPPPTGCYKAEKDEAGGTGNYRDAVCTEEVPPLKGEYVLAEPLLKIAEGLWCAMVTKSAKTGLYEDGECTKNAADGSYTKVIVNEGRQFEMLLTNAANEKGASCNSEGAASGEVVLKGAFDVVYTSLSPLEVGLLFLLEASTITCGSVKIKVRGSMLGPLLYLGSSESTEYTSLNTALEGNGYGKPTYTTYYNDSGETVKAKLETNFGSGYKESAEEVEGEITPAAQEGKMFVITGR